jgi:hypothetical protein
MKLPRSPARAVHRSKSGSLMSGLGHWRQTETLPTLATCPLRPESGQTAVSLGMSALCH